MTQTPSILKKEDCWKELILPKQQFESCKDQVLHFMMRISKALNLFAFLQVHLFRTKCLKTAELLHRFGLINHAELDFVLLPAVSTLFCCAVQIKYGGSKDTVVQFLFYKPIRYQWRETDFFPCSVTCGGGELTVVVIKNAFRFTFRV